MPRSSHHRSIRAVAATGVAGLAIAVGGFASGASASSASSHKCPTASLVGAKLSEKLSGPSSQKFTYGVNCTYKGGLVPTTVDFQEDTASTFAAGEKAASVEGVVAVHGLGQAAFAAKSGGLLEVYSKGLTIKIDAPLVATSKLEALARALL